MVACARWIMARVRREQDVVERAGHLLACRVQDLGARVGQSGHDGLEQLGPSVGQGEDLGRGRAVATEEARLGLRQRDRVAGPWSWHRGAGGTW